jgi:hypothetical protein
MAVTFTLTSTGLVTQDLTVIGSAFSLQPDYYIPVVSTPTGDGSIPPYVTETIPVMLAAANYDTYASYMQNLAAHQKRAAEYWVNSQQTTPVWLTCKLDAETTARQTLVKSIHFEFRDVGWTEWLYQECPNSAAPARLFGTLLIERHPYWERTSSALALPNTTPSAAASVAYDYTSGGDIVGDVPARINALAIRGATGGRVLQRLWMGIRSATLHGAAGVTNFTAVWECEAGTNIADASISDDGGGTEPNTASPGSGSGDYVDVDPEAGGAVLDWDAGTLLAVFVLDLSDVGYATTEFDDAAGRFLWLLRCKVTAGTWEVQMRVSGFRDNNFSTGDPIEVSGTDWDYKEMGVFTFPQRNLKAIDSTHLAIDLGDNRVWIFARRTSGVGDLRLDCLCPVPIDEGFLKVEDANATTNYDCWFGQGPGEQMQVISVLDAATDVFSDICPFEAENFRLPPGDGRIICVYAESSLSVFTDQIEFADTTVGTSAYTPRWAFLRGSE